MTRKLTRRIVFGLALTMFLLSNVIAHTPHAQAATRCFANTCNGYSPTLAIGPNGNYCSADARTLDPQHQKGIGGDVTAYDTEVELRYSSNCNAAWVRMTDTVGDWCTLEARGWVTNSVGARADTPSPGCGGSPNSKVSTFSPMVSDTTGQVASACGQTDYTGSLVCTGSY